MDKKNSAQLAVADPAQENWSDDLRRILIQYLSIRYTDRLAEAGFNTSVGSVGDSYDNALAESINGLYKAEVIHKEGPWRGLDDVERATLTWVEWFNHRRLLRPIGDVPPVEYELMYYEQTESRNVA